MKKEMGHRARTASELAELLGLDPADAVDIEFRSKLNKKIIETVKARKLTHEQAARLTGTSRTRLTAILNGNTAGVSSDLLFRILYSLGYKTKVSFAPVQITSTTS